MRERFQDLKARLMPERERHAEAEEAPLEGFGVLQLLAAHLLLFTGIGSTVDAVGRTGEDAAGGRSLPGARGAAWAPTVLGPMAAIAHLKHVASPTPATASATRLFDTAAVGAGLVGMLHGLAGTRRSGELPSLTPLALASAGVLGLMLERRERESEQERRRLEQRAAVVERLVPRRRARLDRIVLHV